MDVHGFQEMGAVCARQLVPQALHGICRPAATPDDKRLAVRLVAATVSGIATKPEPGQVRPGLGLKYIRDTPVQVALLRLRVHCQRLDEDSIVRW